MPEPPPVADLIARVLRGEPEVVRDPHPLYARIREHARAVRAPVVGPVPAVHLARYDDVHAAVRDPRLSSERDLGGGVPEPVADPTPEERAGELASERVQGLSLLTTDPPAHTRLRGLVQRAFSPRIVGRQEPNVGAVLDDLLAAAAREGEVDFMRAVAVPLPALVIAALLGVPQEDWPRFTAWSEGSIVFDPEARRRGLANSARLDAYLRDLVDRRRAEPRDDLVSALVRARDEDDALSEDEIVAQCTILLVGGHETTTAALGSALALLDGRRDLWAAMRERPEIVPAVAEECVRLESPFQFNSRVAKDDLELGGEGVRAGELVWLWVAAANRDPRRFPDPDTLDPERGPDGRPVAHQAFGGGIHFCLGAALARLELRLALGTLARRHPGLELLDRPVRWRDNLALRGPEAVPVRLGPARADA